MHHVRAALLHAHHAIAAVKPHGYLGTWAATHFHSGDGNSFFAGLITFFVLAAVVATVRDRSRSRRGTVRHGRNDVRQGRSAGDYDYL